MGLLANETPRSQERTLGTKYLRSRRSRRFAAQNDLTQLLFVTKAQVLIRWCGESERMTYPTRLEPRTGHTTRSASRLRNSVSTSQTGDTVRHVSTARRLQSPPGRH